MRELDKDYSGTQVIDYNGKPITVDVRVYTDFDELFDLNDFEDEATRNQLERDIERGRADVLVIMIEVDSKDVPGVQGLDALGGCIVYNRNDFKLLLEEHQMIHNAILDFKAQIPIAIESLSERLAKLNSLEAK